MAKVSSIRVKKQATKDDECVRAIANPNMLVPWFLMASYLYYIEDVSILSDTLYDRLCNMLDQQWDSIEHFHKHLVPRADLSAGTGFAITDYPERVRGAALRLAHSL